MDVNKSRKDLLQSIIIIAIMLFVGFLPPFGMITELGMRILGIFLGCIIGWCMGHMIWPSILGLILVGLTDYSTVNEVLSVGLGYTTFWLVGFAFWL